MALYSIWVFPESNISLTGGAILDGVTQGDGSHLVGEFLTINSTDATEIFVDDTGAETNFADNDNGQDLDQDITIDGVTYTAGTGIEAEYIFVLVDDNTGIEYTAVAINIVSTSPSYGTIEALSFRDVMPPAGVALRIDRASEGPTNGGPGAIDEAELVPICFCRGTNIATQHGSVPVEALRSGDQIVRGDGTLATLKHVLSSSFSARDVAKNEKLRPVRISSSALGPGLPERDLCVSRQHRLLVDSAIAERMFNTREVLVPAVKLLALPGVALDTSAQEVEYFHLLFDDHEIILAEGTPTESLLVGKQALSAMGQDARDELLMIFPDLANPDFCHPPARSIPPNSRQNRLIERHRKNAKALVETR